VAWWAKNDFEKKWKEAGGLFQGTAPSLYAVVQKDWDKSWKISVRNVGNPAKIRAEKPQNIRRKRYYLRGNLLGVKLEVYFSVLTVLISLVDQ
jgi:hypothetical protein